jgi:hypothetical protein
VCSYVLFFRGGGEGGRAMGKQSWRKLFVVCVIGQKAFVGWWRAYKKNSLNRSRRVVHFLFSLQKFKTQILFFFRNAEKTSKASAGGWKVKKKGKVFTSLSLLSRCYLRHVYWLTQSL